MTRVIFGRCSLLCLLFLFASHIWASNQFRLYQYEQKDSLGNPGVRLIFYSPNLSQYIPHIIRQYEQSVAMHTELWKLHNPLEEPCIWLTDMEDDGNGGAAPLPANFIGVGMAPVNQSYYINPSVERYAHLFRHEYTHIVMTDRPNAADSRYRSFFGAKVVADASNPITTLWSYLTTPRWYAPRWYHEGIACFLETWMSGGVGRALGGYDEMYFRSLVADSARLSTVVGLESEGTTKDFQLGTNAYLYGLRFVNYLVLIYGPDKVLDFYNRTDDSKKFFASQFRKVFGKSLTDTWNEWQIYEREHQHRNLAAIRKYPETTMQPLTNKPYGSASPLIVDDSLGVAYVAVNYPGYFAHIERIHLATGERKKISKIDGPMLYQTAYIALDRKRQRLFWTERNSALRGLKWKSVGESLLTDDKPLSGKKKYQRVSNIVYDNSRDCLYGLLSHEGVTNIVRYDASLEKQNVLYTFKFGVSVSDLDVSPDGNTLSMTISGVRGEQSLVLFNVDDLDNANYTYRTLKTLDDSNLTQFRFTPDGKSLVGTSYYTGVANLWSIDIEDGEMHLLSNVSSGLFAPVVTSSGQLYAHKFSHEGFTPVRMEYRELKDCNSVDFLGQEAYKAHPEIASYSNLAPDARRRSFSEVYDSITLYKPLKHLAFQGAYPIVSGFSDTQSWNDVTPVLGYAIHFSDPLSLNSIKLSLGVSPWSNNPWKNRFHAAVELQTGFWNFSASWNKPNFYDLFGPTRVSRKGYDIGAAYTRSYTFQSPFKWGWNVAVNVYGDMDALPMYQNVSVDKSINSFYTASADIYASKTRTSLGGTMPEQGYSVGLNTYTYLADGKFYPSLIMTLDKGVLLPVMRNTCAWLRLAIGQNFGSDDLVFGNTYFGGFRNNYVDYRAADRYRSVASLPGMTIDAVSAHSFCKATGELNLQPLRFRNTGLLYLYPTYAQLSLFATDLMANPWGKQSFGNYLSIGAQVNVEVVLYNYMKTTVSFGYARCMGQESAVPCRSGGEWLLSIKLL